MERSRRIQVLVIDDSPLFREAMVRAITSDRGLEIAGVASNAFEARDRLAQNWPDVITCDVEMPRMNGIDFVRWLLPLRFVPVVMVSAVSDKVFEAMEAGAVDFVVKPGGPSLGAEAFRLDLLQKIRAAASITARPPRPLRPAASRVLEGAGTGTGRLIAIGASTGGTEAIYNLLRALPPSMPGMVVVQHIPPVFSKMFADRLDSQTALRVKEAETGDWIDPGTVLIAPGDRHLRVKKAGSRFQAECFAGEKVGGHCPSVDVLFDSAARMAGERAIGILLTGMGADGARGLLNIRQQGGRTIGQNEATSVVYGMPKAAFDLGAVETQAALENIPQLLINLLK